MVVHDVRRSGDFYKDIDMHGYDILNAGNVARPVTFVVCAHDAIDTTNCDYLCDGIADEVQINDAINSLPTNGGFIKLSEGTFSISSPITINKAGVTLSGTGIEGTLILLADNSNCDMVEIDVDIVDQFFHMRDLTLNGNKANQISGRGFYDGAGASEIQDVRLEDVFFQHIKEETIELDNAWGFNADRVIIEFGGSDGIVINAGGNARIYGSKIISNAGRAIVINGGNFHQIMNNLLRSADNTCAIYLGSTYNIINGNVISDLAGGVNYTGILVDENNNLISDNIIYGSAGLVHTIELTSDADYNYVTSNISYGAVGDDLLLDNGVGNLIVQPPNRYNPRYVIHGNLEVTGQMGLGIETPATSALLDLTSTTGALLLTRMTTAEKTALTAVNGMIVYDSTLNKVQIYEAGGWVSVV